MIARDVPAGMFARNIDNTGRIVRALLALALLAGAFFAGRAHGWIAVLLLIAGAFALFEAVRGWCGLRACGIRTKL